MRYGDDVMIILVQLLLRNHISISVVSFHVGNIKGKGSKHYLDLTKDLIICKLGTSFNADD